MHWLLLWLIVLWYIHDSSTYIRKGHTRLVHFQNKKKTKQKHTRAHSMILIYLELLHWFSHVLGLKLNFFHIFFGWSESMVRRGEKNLHGWLYVGTHTIALTLLCWIELDGRGEGGGGGGYFASHILHLDLFGVTPSPSGFTIHFQLWLNFNEGRNLLFEISLTLTKFTTPRECVICMWINKQQASY